MKKDFDLVDMGIFLGLYHVSKRLKEICNEIQNGNVDVEELKDTIEEMDEELSTMEKKIKEQHKYKIKKKEGNSPAFVPVN